MPTATPKLTETQEQALKAIEQAQDASLKYASAVAENWHFPTPERAIESSFDFAGRVLELQKQYTLRLAGVAQKAAQN